MLTKRNIRASAVALGVAAALMVPGVAQAGFFEQLFGLQPQAPQPSPEPGYGYGYEAAPRPPRVHHKRHLAEVDRKTGRQTPTDIMHDATLRPGDAIMMKDGIHVYKGDEASHHDADDFVGLDDAGKVSRRERQELVAMDTTRNDPLRGNLAPDTIASGRSASVSTPITSGYKITDAHGKSIRYVGP